MNTIELGKFIAKLRNEKNLTQEELAEKLYIDKRKISRWECGTSLPEFDMLIKLSEILDVSLYELSICKRIENEFLTRKVINKFKSLKDFKNYNNKRKIKTFLLFILLIIFIITSVYTIKYNGTVEIYELKSLDDKYYIEGNYIRIKNINMFNIQSVDIIANNRIKNSKELKECEYEIYDNNDRILHIINDNRKLIDLNQQKLFHEFKDNKISSAYFKFYINCTNNDHYNFKIKLIKKYDNKLF